MSKRTVRTMAYAVAVTIILAGLASAATKPTKAPKAKVPPRGSIVIYTNFVGAFPFWDITSGYFVDGSNYFNQVLAMGFKTSSAVTFADTALAMGIYSGGGGKVDVYLAADAGGVPGTILDGPLSQQYWVQTFNNAKGGGIVQFNCVACPALAANTSYWIIANQTHATNEMTWDFADTDFSAPFAFDQTGSITGPWSAVPSGYIRSAFQVDGN
ncbi:MAG TPA: choice-of-anchor R domain-containing protein [Terriglobales bacterium]|nr:choice-of-anchor R domain-containing protein [Terriglobales bacterium]